MSPADPNWQPDTDPNRLQPDERYRRDPHFRTIVDWLEHMVREAKYTPTELREAVLLACIHYEERRLPEPLWLPRQTPEAGGG